MYFVGGVVSMRSNFVSVSTQNIKEAFSVDDGDKDLVFVVGFVLMINVTAHICSYKSQL